MICRNRCPVIDEGDMQSWEERHTATLYMSRPNSPFRRTHDTTPVGQKLKTRKHFGNPSKQLGRLAWAKPYLCWAPSRRDAQVVPSGSLKRLCVDVANRNAETKDHPRRAMCRGDNNHTGNGQLRGNPGIPKNRQIWSGKGREVP